MAIIIAMLVIWAACALCAAPFARNFAASLAMGFFGMVVLCSIGLIILGVVAIGLG